MTSTLSTYTTTHEFMLTKRNPEKGVNITPRVRVTQYNDYKYMAPKYKISVDKHHVATIRPNNTITFDIPPEFLWDTSKFFSRNITKFLPFWWSHKQSGRHRIGHVRQYKKCDTPHIYCPSQKMVTKAPYNMILYFPKISFCLSNGACYNLCKQPKHITIPEKRREWLQAKREWLVMVNAAIKLGAFDSLILHMEKNRVVAATTRAFWDKGIYVDVIYHSMKENRLGMKLMNLLAARCACTYTPPDHNAIYKTVKATVDRCSVQLRERFGVFE